MAKLDYPKTQLQNLQYRAQLVLECERDRELRSAVKGYFQRDILYAFNVWFWAYDPKREEKRKNRPIITYPFQDSTILEIRRWIEDQENGFIDKSREMLATYMVLLTFLWGWLTKHGESYRIGSWKEDFVDKSGVLDTLFEKLRYNLRRLPPFLLPAGFDIERDMPYMKLVNLENQSTIIGEATNADFARAGRNTAVLFDELQSWDSAEDAWRSASDSTRSKIAVGTPKGAGNKLAELSRTDEVKNKLHLLWYLSPEKAVTSEEHIERVKRGEVFSKVLGRKVEYAEDQSTVPSSCYLDVSGKVRSEWYDEEESRRDAKDVKENLDCDYLTTGNPIFDTYISNKRLAEASYPVQVGNLEWTLYPIFNTAGQCTNVGTLKCEFVPNINGRIQVWSAPETGWENGYCIGADTAEGLEQGDYDSAYVLARFFTKPKVVAKIRGHLAMHVYAEELAKLATFYENAFVAVERNNHGHAVIQQLVRIYTNLAGKDLFTKGYEQGTGAIGFETTSMSKPVVIGTLGKAISFDQFECPDANFWRETLTFVEDDGKMEAQGKSRGDRSYDDDVMAMAITLWTHLKAPLPSRKIPPRDYPSWVRKPEKKYEGHLVGWVV